MECSVFQQGKNMTGHQILVGKIAAAQFPLPIFPSPPPPPHGIKIADTILPASQQQSGNIVRKAAAPILCILLQPRYSV